MADYLKMLTIGALVCACQVHDPNLIDQGDEQTVDLADTCSGDVPLAESHHDHVHVSLDQLHSDVGGLAACGAAPVLAGADGFLRLDVAAGERWHIEATPEDSAQDVAVYLLNSCDALSCQLVMNRCGPGFPEDFTFVAKNAGEYFLGIDQAEGAGEVELLVLRTQCGDGDTEHGEACDDGNLDDGDGCDSNCRHELSGTAPEIEPNNWHTEANKIVFGAGGNGTVTVTGKLGGPCDTDHFAFSVPAGGSVYAALYDGAGLPCAAGHAAVDMRFMDPATGTMRGRGNAGGQGGKCPSIEPANQFSEALPAGEYHLVMSSDGGVEAFDYKLELTMVTQ